MLPGRVAMHEYYARLPICMFTYAHPSKQTPLEDNLLRCASKRTSAKTAPLKLCVSVQTMQHFSLRGCLLIPAAQSVNMLGASKYIGKIQFHRCNYFAPVTQSAPSARAVGSFYAIFNTLTLTVSLAAQPSRSHAKTCIRGY
jgi:hypothetical protein